MTPVIVAIWSNFVGELSSLEEVVGQMLVHQPALLKPSVIEAIWQSLRQFITGTQSSEITKQSLASGCILINMIAAKQPGTLVDNLDLLLKVDLPALV